MEETQVVEPQVEARKQDIYSRHVEGFIKAIESGMDKALGQYGFTVWHSVPAKQATMLKERLGVRQLDVSDLYNRGTVHAQEGRWAQAEADLRAALKMDAEHASAAFNLAVCLEKQERVKEARELYDSYLKILDRARGRRETRWGSDADMAQEMARIQQHLETIGKS